MTFFAPFFLIGLLGIALPIWLHRLSYSDPPTKRFSSIMLLRPTLQNAATRSKLRYLLLLAARILALLVLVALFSQPAWQRETATDPGSGVTHHIVILDRSLSMQAGDTWSQALSRVQAIAEGLPVGDTAELMTADLDLRSVVASTSDATELSSALSRVTAGTATIDYGRTMQSLADFARGHETRVRAHFISDFQLDNFPDRFSDLIPARVELELHRLGPTVPNWALTASLEGNELVAIVSGNRTSEQLVRVRLQGDAGEVATEQVNVPANGSATLRFALPPADAPIKAQYLELDVEDGLALDNRFWLPAGVSQPLRALILSGSLALDDATWVESALKSLSNPQFAVETLYGGGNPAIVAADYDLIVAMNVNGLSPASIGALRASLERGGSVLAAFRGATRGETLNGLTAHRLLADAQPISSANLVVQNASHPALEGTGGGLNGRIFSPPRLELLDTDRVLVASDRGHPWLVEADGGNGRLLLLSQPLDTGSTDLVLSPDFVPLMQSTARYLARASDFKPFYESGERLLAGMADSSSVRQITRPDGRPILTLAEQNRSTSVALAEPGLYGLQIGTQTRQVAVNVPARELNLTYAEDAILTQWASQSGLGNGSDTSVSANLAADLRQWHLSLEWLLLPLLLLLLLIETMLGNAHLRVHRERTA